MHTPKKIGYKTNYCTKQETNPCFLMGINEKFLVLLKKNEVSK